VRTIKEDIATTDLGKRRLKERIEGWALTNRGIAWLCDRPVGKKTSEPPRVSWRPVGLSQAATLED